MNTSYSTLEEAWGGDIAGRPTRKNDQSKKKKPPTDPICDLYASKVSSSSYNETDLVKFANEYFDKFEKSKYQRNMKTVPLSYEEVEREPSTKNLTISKGESRYDLSKRQSEDYPLFQKQFEMKLPPLYDGGECPEIIQDNSAPQKYAETKPVAGYTYAEWEDRPVCRPKRRVSCKNRDSVNSEYYTTSQEEFQNSSQEDIYQEGECEQEGDLVDDIYQETIDNSYNGGRDYYNRICDESGYRDRGERPYKYTGRRVKEGYNDEYEDDDFNHPFSKKKFSNLQILDLVLYVVSGIILIFLLEQFVRIGINISR